MINLLNSSTDLLSITTSTAATCDVLASWVDLNSTTVTPGRTGTALASAATTTVVATPSASTTRNVKTITIYNKHASLACDITVNYNANGTLYQLCKITLQTGEVLEYIEGVGFFVLKNTAKYNVTKYVTANSVHATAATFAGITGLSFDVLSGKSYNLVAHFYHKGNATTTGAQFAIGGVAMTAMQLGSMSVVTSGVATTTMSSGTATAVDTAVIVQTTSSVTDVPTILSGWFQPSASGTLLIKATSEVTVAAGLTIAKGSWARVRETDN